MIEDKEIKECEEFLKNKECEMCKKFLNDCNNMSGIYKYFENKNPQLIKASLIKNYVKPARAIIRSFPVCQKHFNIIKKDNDKRQKKGYEIKNNLELLNYRRSYL